LKPVGRWSKTSIGAVPIGQEVTVTAVQLVTAIAAIANNGVMMKPYFIKHIKSPSGEISNEHRPQILTRVMKEATAQRLRSILQGVVENGTATQVKMKDITAGGKTGTAQKVVNGMYSHSAFMSSFIGFAPVDDAKLAIVLTFDEPHPAYYGGVVAGPAFKEIVENSLRYLASRKGM
ncbi:MAG: hypothetical protein HQL21_05700, partial [Candidatus Omnitrophica bacterium]|nr:hypothetical protein [Candidatus Omnitrophota bacterium]